MISARLILAGFSILAAAGIGLKSQALQKPSSGISPKDRYVWLDERLAANGLHHVATHTLTVDGNFNVRLYRTLACQRPVMVLPLSRNAEGANLLKSRIDPAEFVIRFVHNGKSYSEFPVIEQFLSQVQESLNPVTPDKLAPIVYATAWHKDCPDWPFAKKILVK